MLPQKRNFLELWAWDRQTSSRTDGQTDGSQFAEFRSSNSRVEEAKRRTPIVDQQFCYVRLAAPPLDLAGSVPSFVRRSVLRFISLIR